MQCKSKLMDIWAIANSNNFKEGMIDYKNNRNIPMHKENDFMYIYGRQYAASKYKTINYRDIIQFNYENLVPMMKYK